LILEKAPAAAGACSIHGSRRRLADAYQFLDGLLPDRHVIVDDRADFPAADVAVAVEQDVVRVAAAVAQAVPMATLGCAVAAIGLIVLQLIGVEVRLNRTYRIVTVADCVKTSTVNISPIIEIW